MNAKEIQRLKEWLTLKGKTEAEAAECICYITTGILIDISKDKEVGE